MSSSRHALLVAALAAAMTLHIASADRVTYRPKVTRDSDDGLRVRVAEDDDKLEFQPPPKKMRVRFGEVEVREIPSWREELLTRGLDKRRLSCGGRELTLRFPENIGVGARALLDGDVYSAAFFEEQWKGEAGFMFEAQRGMEFEISVQGSGGIWLTHGAQSDRCTPGLAFTAKEQQSLLAWQLDGKKFRCTSNETAVPLSFDFSYDAIIAAGEYFIPQFYGSAKIRGFRLVPQDGSRGHLFYFNVAQPDVWRLVWTSIPNNSTIGVCQPQ